MGATAAVSEKYLSCMETFIKGELLQELQELKNEVGQFTRKVGELKSEIHCISSRWVNYCDEEIIGAHGKK